MVGAEEIAEVLARTHSDGQALAIVSLIERSGRLPSPIERLLVAEDGVFISGTLGEHALDQLAVHYARQMMTDVRREIATADLNEIKSALASKFIDNEISSLIGDLRLLVEIARPPLELIICGGGHVGRAIASAAQLLDFRVTVIDDRAEFVSRERFPDSRIQLIADDFAAALNSIKITLSSHIVIVTRGHRHDEICLREVISQPARYIGMIGSRRRTTTIREHLRREGVSAELLRRVHAPIGLDIGAQTPEEVAIAILAEIILVRRGGIGAPKSATGPMARMR